MAGFLSDHRPLTDKQRARTSRVLVAGLAAVPAVAILMLANSPAGFSGTISKAWHQAINPTAPTPDQHAFALHRRLVGTQPLLARGDRHL